MLYWMVRAGTLSAMGIRCKSKSVSSTLLTPGPSGSPANDIQVQAIIATASIIFNIFFMRETRADVLLSWRAKKMTKETGVKHVAAADLEKTDMLTLVKVSLIRPLRECWSFCLRDQRLQGQY